MKKTKQAMTIVAALGMVAVAPLSALADEKGATYESNGVVEFIPNTDPTDPVDPNNPDPEVPVNPVDPTDPEGPNPGTNGPLSIDYASSLDFGINKISNKDMTYYAKAQELSSDEGSTYVPNYVQISDNRGTNAGWTLTVKQEGQLSNDTTQNKELTGSQIQFVDPTVASHTEVKPPTPADVITLDPNGAESLVMSAKQSAGAGLWVDRWGTVEEMTGDQGEKVQKTKAISLTIPGKTPKDAVKYSTKLTWNLSDVPGNE
ncbi:WxL domain-containing protein [Bacillus pseudomycoides]|uniref:WxL domain-containing protein n=1 Tax=Bacillus bingmayongensis TaxID=1150157 RepID=A0ABU5JSH0_9BACI|nr:WxL domain-containing protein [Bacillus pseudomycoides]